MVFRGNRRPRLHIYAGTGDTESAGRNCGAKVRGQKGGVLLSAIKEKTDSYCGATDMGGTADRNEYDAIAWRRQIAGEIVKLKALSK